MSNWRRTFRQLYSDFEILSTFDIRHSQPSYKSQFCHTSTLTSSPSTTTRKLLTPSNAGAESTSPVFKSNAASCQGQITLPPSTCPSDNGPPAWGQVSSIA